MPSQSRTVRRDPPRPSPCLPAPGAARTFFASPKGRILCLALSLPAAALFLLSSCRRADPPPRPAPTEHLLDEGAEARQKQAREEYFEAMHRRMKTFAPGSMAMFVLKSAGGINVAVDAPRVRNTNIAAYGKERILARAGEIDVFLAQQGRMNPVTTIDVIRKEPGFQVIKAVKNNQIYLVDEKLVSRPTLELIQGIGRIFALLYPEYCRHTTGPQK